MKSLEPTYTLRVAIVDAASEITPHMLQAQMLQGQFGATPNSARKYFKDGKTGCDEVLAAVREALLKAGIRAEVTFERFEHK